MQLTLLYFAVLGGLKGLGCFSFSSYTTKSQVTDKLEIHGVYRPELLILVLGVYRNGGGISKQRND